MRDFHRIRVYQYEAAEGIRELYQPREIKGYLEAASRDESV